MKNNYFLKKTKTAPLRLLFFVCLLFANVGWGQTTVFTETFGTTTVASTTYNGGTSTPNPVTYTRNQVGSVPMGTLVYNTDNQYLYITGNASGMTNPSYNSFVGNLSAYDSAYNTTLSSNVGKVSWTFNFRALRTGSQLSANTASATNWGAVVLCSSGANLFTGSGTNGYAVLYNKEASGTANNTLKLVKFTNGLQGTVTTIATSSGLAYGTIHHMSVKVTYDPVGNNWTLSTRDDGTALPFIDPASGSLTLNGTVADADYVATTMTNFGFVCSTLTTNGNGFYYENFKVVVDPPSVTPTILKTATTLTGFSTTTASSSVSQTFNVSGTNLTNNLVVTTVSTDYELSTASNFASTTLPITLAPSSGTVLSTPIYVRLKAGLTSGIKSGTIAVSSTGANTLSDVTVDGSVLGVYYYAGSGSSLSTPSNWWTNSNESGVNPSNLSGDNTIFYIKNGSATTDASWTLGMNSKIIVGDITAPAVTLTIVDTFPIIGGTIDITAASTGSNSVVVQDKSSLVSPVFGVLNANSEVHYQSAGVYNNGSPTYGKLIIDGGSGGTNLINNPVIQTSLTVASGATMVTTSNTSAYFYFNSGATATINGFLWTTKANGLFNFSVATPTTTGGSFQFADASPLTIDANSIIGYSRNTTPIQTVSVLPTGVNYANLNVELTNIPSPVAVTGKLTVSGALTTNGNLTLKSTATKTAYVAPVTGSITGNVIVERFIPAGHRAYRLLSVPTSGGTIKSNWQEGQASLVNGNPGLGMHITGAGGSTNGFDQTSTNAPSIFTYNSTIPAWDALVNTNGTLNAGNPYLVYVRGSRQVTNIDGTLTNDATTLRSTGVLTTGTVGVAVTPTADSFTAVGNPYQSQVDMETVLGNATNLAPFYYVVDPALNGKGAYVAVDVTAPIAPFTKFLQAGQAFFVKTVSTAPASISFTEGDKSDAVAQTSIFKTRSSIIPSLEITLNDGAMNRLDVLKVAFDANETNDVNKNDAVKMTNFDENMATSNNGKLLAIEKRALPTTADVIPLNITKYRGTSYFLRIQGSSLTEAPFLVDNYTNTKTEIPQDGTIDYAFAVDAGNAASADASRFKLIYAKTLNTNANTIAGFVIYPNPSKSNSFNIVVPQSASKTSITVSNLLGQKLYSQNEMQSGATAITVSNVKTAGVYLVSMTSEGKTATTKWIVE